MNWIRWARIALWVGLLISVGVWLNMLLTPTPNLKNEDGPRGDFVLIEGQHVHFFEKGEGPVIVLLHGFPLHAESYTPLMQYAWGKHRVIALDLPEQGYSDKPGQGYTPDDYSLILKLFLDKLEIKNLELVGHDLGADVAIAFAAHYPGMVKKMVLLSPLLESFATAPQGWWWRCPVLGEVWSWLFLNHTWFRQWLKQGWRSPYASWETVVEKYYQPVRTYEGRKGFLAVVRANFNYAFPALMERLHTPTLVIFGEKDPYYRSPFPGADPTRSGIVKFYALPQVGHLLMEEAPRQTYEKIVEFFGLESTPVETPLPAPNPTTAASVVEP